MSTKWDGYGRVRARTGCGGRGGGLCIAAGRDATMTRRAGRLRQLPERRERGPATATSSSPASRAPGDACDPDDDNDGILDAAVDGCPTIPSAVSIDTDGDGVQDPCDNCQRANGTAAGTRQLDSNSDGQGNACETVAGALSPFDLDADGDQVADAVDNCPGTPNPDQRNGDKLKPGEPTPAGDACDPDDDNDGQIDGTDNDDDNDGVHDASDSPDRRTRRRRRAESEAGSRRTASRTPATTAPARTPTSAPDNTGGRVRHHETTTAISTRGRVPRIPGGAATRSDDAIPTVCDNCPHPQLEQRHDGMASATPATTAQRRTATRQLRRGRAATLRQLRDGRQSRTDNDNDGRRLCDNCAATEPRPTERTAATLRQCHERQRPSPATTARHRHDGR